MQMPLFFNISSAILHLNPIFIFIINSHGKHRSLLNPLHFDSKKKKKTKTLYHLHGFRVVSSGKNPLLTPP